MFEDSQSLQRKSNSTFVVPLSLFNKTNVRSCPRIAKLISKLARQYLLHIIVFSCLFILSQVKVYHGDVVICAQKTKLVIKRAECTLNFFIKLNCLLRLVGELMRLIIARVTYLLALAPVLMDRKGSLSIPVYLGDAMQLSISKIVGGKELTIRVPPPPAGEGASGARDSNGRAQLDFPDTFYRDRALFDKAIERMRSGSEAGMTRAQIEAALIRITEQHYRADMTNEQSWR